MSTIVRTLDFVSVFSDVLYDERVSSATCSVDRPEGSCAKLYSDNNPGIVIVFKSFDDEICPSYAISACTLRGDVEEYHDGEISDLPHAVSTMIDNYF